MNRRSLRTRLTLIYGSLFVSVSTAAVVTSTLLIQAKYDRALHKVIMTRDGTPPTDLPALSANGRIAYGHFIYERHNLVNYQWIITGIVVAVLAALAFAVSWWLAGRVLRPLHRITDTAQRLSLSRLDERIALTGPRDELKELADTFDAMLDRLEQGAASQRRFIANASHELRTPLAIQRAAIEIGLADPDPARVKDMQDELLRANERSERLIDGLLTLAQGERGLDARTPVDLEQVVRQVTEPYDRVTVDLRPVATTGDEVMLTRLIANLVENAVKYNVPGGEVWVRLDEHGLTVRNTGPHVDPDRIQDLFEPFRRLHGDRTGEGAGLGLSIVAAIAAAHDAPVTATANPGGGLTVTVAFAALVPA